MASHKFFVAGTPAPFATRGEALWKEMLLRGIPRAPSEEFRGIRLRFSLGSLAPNNQPLDVDNLCEPVFSVLVNKLGWFGGRRPNIQWWRASKLCEHPTGLHICVESGPPPDMAVEYGKPLFEGVYRGRSPSKATDPEIPTWLNSLGTLPLPMQSETYAMAVQFGQQTLNLGDISTGKVKSVVDCLYPLLGGVAGSPQDWRVGTLQLEKGTVALGDSLRLMLWSLRASLGGQGSNSG